MPDKKAREKLAKQLSQHLSGFGSEFLGCFLCPICMTPFSFHNESDKLTAAHIIPDSAGGKEWTILCNTCNSKFGKAQDKWFGEYLCILNNPEGTFLHAKSKSKYITINGVKVSGTVSVSSEDGSIEIIVPTNRNPPKKVESISYEPTLEVKFTPEIIKHVNEVQVGYITAAYLMWFKFIGYNWVMQSSLTLVRKQIIECDYMLDGAKIVDLDCDSLHEPDIGVIFSGGYAYPCCLIYDRVVIFPASNGSKAPSPKKVFFENTQEIHFLNLAILDKPYAVNFDGCIMVLPDMLRNGLAIPKYMLCIYADADKKIDWLILES